MRGEEGQGSGEEHSQYDGRHQRAREHRLRLAHAFRLPLAAVGEVPLHAGSQHVDEHGDGGEGERAQEHADRGHRDLGDIAPSAGRATGRRPWLPRARPGRCRRPAAPLPARPRPATTARRPADRVQRNAQRPERGEHGDGQRACGRAWRAGSGSGVGAAASPAASGPARKAPRTGAAGSRGAAARRRAPRERWPPRPARSAGAAAGGPRALPSPTVPDIVSVTRVRTTSPSLTTSPSRMRERSVLTPLTRMPLALPLSRMTMPSPPALDDGVMARALRIVEDEVARRIAAHGGDVAGDLDLVRGATRGTRSGTSGINPPDARDSSVKPADTPAFPRSATWSLAADQERGAAKRRLSGGGFQGGRSRRSGPGVTSPPEIRSSS